MYLLYGLFDYLMLFVGGGIGTLLRFNVQRFAFALTPNFPLGTMLINIFGCLLMGFVTSWFAFKGEHSSQTIRFFTTTGLLGGFTTFSAFSLDAASLWQRGEMAEAALYVVGSVVISLIAVFAGLALGRSIFS